jgi:transposase-like protein
MSTWTDELKEEAVALYLKGKPTPDTSMDVVGEVADQMGFSPNSVRMILSKAGVYITKSQGGAAKEKKAAGTRVSKEGAQAALIEKLEAAGKEVNEEIISKLTGKAAQYFASLF